MQQPGQYRDPPPYPGHSKQLLQTGTRKSFSGSENSTDVSLSSLDNVSTSQRQEPQGEEMPKGDVSRKSADVVPESDLGYSILARLGMPSSFTATTHPQWTRPVALPSSHPLATTAHELTHPGHPPLTVYQTAPNMSTMAYTTHSLWKQNTEAIHMGPGGVTYYPHPHPPPPPEYPGIPVRATLGNPSIDSKDSSRSYDLVDKGDLQGSRSQPDLGRYVAMQSARPEHLHAYYSSGDIKLASQDLVRPGGDDWEHPGMASRASTVVDILTEENRQLRAELASYETKVSKLQKFELEIQRVHESYESLVKSSQKRERLEEALKKRMEEEISKLKSENWAIREQLEQSVSSRAKSLDNLCQVKSPLSLQQYHFGNSESLEESVEKCSDVGSLRRLCHQKEAKILQLEGELLQWEQRYLEESARKLSMEDDPKDMQLAALGHNSRETSRLIAEAKVDKLRNMEELYQANRRVTELEARVKSLESQLTEKEAMIRVLQKSSLPRSSSVHSIYCSPLHSPRHSLLAPGPGERSRGGSQNSSAGSDHAFFCEYGTIKHVKTSSAGAVDTNKSSVSEQKEKQEKSSEVEQTLWHV